ncbi:hypothetical protein Hypma_010516 [Hypsizygus marmoreus]|uniref:Uncharacterized protein n=1 Tax=Hypsizygus marmoreus TaxID=39966 RepID=A0A369JPC5_HYPMA|nr:hypothetical protein Hypma_010516 [Hypsizygus marmoreus]
MPSMRRLARSFPSLLPALVLLVPVIPCWGQAQSTSFSWSFSQNVGTNLPECSSLAVSVPATNTATAFYMIALAVDGVPTTSLIGTNKDNLAWVVDQPTGTGLMLYLVASNGDTGAIPSSLYTVTAGQSKSCLPSSSSNFKVVASPSAELSTCDKWNLTMSGGAPPYNVVLAALDSPHVTNITMPASDNLYSYINRASPNGSLLAAISDSNGRWAAGTPLVKTKGSTATDCGGLLSTSGIAPISNITTTTMSGNTSPTNTTNPSNTSESNSKTPVIVGVCVSIGCVLLIGALAFWLYRHRRKTHMDLEPRSFKETTTSPVSISTSETGHAANGNGYTILAPTRTGKFSAPPASHASTTATSGLFTEGGGSSNEPTASGSTPTSVTRERGLPPKAAEAPNSSNSPASSPQVTAPAVHSMSQSKDSRWPPGMPEQGSSAALNEVIFQHRDAGVVRELPPPYGAQMSQP